VTVKEDPGGKTPRDQELRAPGAALEPGGRRFALDVTQVERIGNALGERRQRLQALFDNALDAMLLADDEARYVGANPAACELLGWDSDEIRQKSVWDVTPGPDRALGRSLWRSFLEAGKARGEYSILRRDGTVIDVEFRAVANIVPGLHLSILRDITERKRAEAEREALVRQLTAQRVELEALSRRLMATQETERQHIARELHDEIGQLLTGLKLSLETAARLPAEASARQLEKALAVVGSLIATVRGMSLDLAPPDLEKIGLAQALKSYFDRYTDQTGVKVRFEQRGGPWPISPGVAIAAYRIVQEALTNVARHAGVKEASVRLGFAGNAVEVAVEDRGRGFDAQSASDRKVSSGLANMRERARLLGGEWTLRSSPGAGTCVIARLLLEAPGGPPMPVRGPESLE
jgi:PAS domain S-box-containing protein